MLTIARACSLMGIIGGSLAYVADAVVTGNLSPDQHSHGDDAPSLSLGCRDGLPPGQASGVEDAYSGTSSGAVLRPRADTEALFGGLELVEPGVVDVARWRGDEPSTPVSILGGIGQVP